MVSPFDAWAVKRALVGHDSTDTLSGVSRMLRPVVEHLRTLPSAEARGIAWQALLCICPFRERLVRAVADADPGGAPPEGETGRRSAHLGDLAATATWLKARGKAPASDAAVEGPESGDRGRERSDVQHHEQL